MCILFNLYILFIFLKEIKIKIIYLNFPVTFNLYILLIFFDLFIFHFFVGRIFNITPLIENFQKRTIAIVRLPNYSSFRFHSLECLLFKFGENRIFEMNAKYF